MTKRVKLFVVVLVTWRLSKTGAAEATVNWSVVGEAGVTFTPAVVAKLGVSVTVSATVPVWSSICDPCPAKSALVLLAGITKSTVLFPVVLPVEN
jgi:hypothetical protein